MLKRCRFFLTLFLFLFLGINYAVAQCPQLLDGTGNCSNNPYWIGCTGGNFSIFIQPDINVGNYTIVWGDGSPDNNGGSIIPPVFVSHLYPATTDTFIVTLTDNSNGCVITGVVVIEQVPTASIVIPIGDPVNGCAPASFNFNNNTQNVSQTTNFTWDFGDGNSSTDEPPQHFYTQQGVYDIMLIASTPNNCIDTFMLSATVEAKSEGEISIPNPFTPYVGGSNGGFYSPSDTDNDVFHPIIVGAEEYELNILNKWRELLYISTDVNVGWDGYYRNELCKQDVYVNKINVKYLDGSSESYVGDLTLLR